MTDQIEELLKYENYNFIRKSSPNAPCAAIALKAVSGIQEQEAVDLIDRLCASWRTNGTPRSVTEEALNRLGLKAVDVNVNSSSHRTTIRDRLSMSEINFRLRYRTGTYLCFVYSHVFAVVDGVTIDFFGNSNKRRITEAWRIESLHNEENVL